MLTARVAIFVTFFLLSACHAQNTRDKTNADAKYFFAKAVRRDPTLKEMENIYRYRSQDSYICTAFAIDQRSEKLSPGFGLVGSARHCFGDQVKEHCASGKLLLENAARNITAKCTKVVAADSKLDITIIQVKFSNSDYRLEGGYKLAAYAPPDKTTLKMIGHPCDKYRNCKPTVTESCWILGSPTDSPYKGMIDESIRHNCSTYGGNSGGPMVASDLVDVALGLPYTYGEDDYDVKDSDNPDSPAYMVLMQSVVKRFRVVLESAGAVIVD